MATITVLYIAVFGLVLGSFLNVVIYRLPRDISLVRPPSSCPACSARIKPYDNIPVLSYILLGGKCRACGKKISPVYPAVEALTALGFVVVFLRSGRSLSLEFVAGCIFTAALIALGFIDHFDGILPSEITLSGFALALAYSFFRDDLTFPAALIGAATGAGFLLLVYGAYFLIRKKPGLGLGDVTMMLMVGAFLGPARMFFTLLTASLVGSLVGLFLILFRGRNFQSELRFGTFLAPAAYVAMLWGETIIQAYKDYWRSLLG